MPFAGFPNFDACVDAQLKRGRSQLSAQKICGYLKHKFEGQSENKQSVKEENKSVVKKTGEKEFPTIRITDEYYRFRPKGRNPEKYIRFRTKTLSASKGIKAVIGFKKNGGSEVQSYLFIKSKWTPKDAKIWLKKLKSEKTNLTYKENINLKEGVINKMTETENLKWTRASINDLPDSCFALVKTPVKNKAEDRALPYKDASGKIDEAHLRNALARINQVKGFSRAAMMKAKAKLIGAAKKMGMKIKEAEKISLGSSETPKKESEGLAESEFEEELLNPTTIDMEMPSDEELKLPLDEGEEIPEDIPGEPIEDVNPVKDAPKQESFKEELLALQKQMGVIDELTAEFKETSETLTKVSEELKAIKLDKEYLMKEKTELSTLVGAQKEELKFYIEKEREREELALNERVNKLVNKQIELGTVREELKEGKIAILKRMSPEGLKAIEEVVDSTFMLRKKEPEGLTKRSVPNANKIIDIKNMKKEDFFRGIAGYLESHRK